VHGKKKLKSEKLKSEIEEEMKLRGESSGAGIMANGNE